MSVFTFGHGGQRPADLAWFLSNPAYDCHLIDIRMSPRSQRPEWNQGPLQTLLGDRYHHVQAFGNRNYANGGEIEIADMDAGFAAIDRWKLFAASRSSGIVLMCGCRDRAGCHRDVVAGEIQRRWNIAATELRFTWRKDVPTKCPVCDRDFEGCRAVRNWMHIGACGHAFVWRPPCASAA